MPYISGSTKSPWRRMRQALTRIGNQLPPASGTALASAVVLVFGLVIVLRRQSEDLKAGAAVCAMGIAGLLWYAWLFRARAMYKQRDQHPHKK